MARGGFMRPTGGGETIADRESVDPRQQVVTRPLSADFSIGPQYGRIVFRRQHGLRHREKDFVLLAYVLSQQMTEGLRFLYETGDIDHIDSNSHAADMIAAQIMFSTHHLHWTGSRIQAFEDRKEDTLLLGMVTSIREAA